MKILSATTNGTHFRLSGFCADKITGGSKTLLGILTLSAPDAQDRFELSVVAGELDTSPVLPFNIISAKDEADDNGLYEFTELTGGDYIMTAGKEINDSLPKAVTAADALAALKIAVGLNPNADSSEVLNYQYLAADANHDGRVRANDTITILRSR